MAAARQTWEIGQEIVQLTQQKEQILRDIRDARFILTVCMHRIR